MAPEHLQLTLRPRAALPDGLAPAGEVRDKHAEHRRAVAKATQQALDAQEPPRKYAMTSWTKGAASDAYKDLAQSVPLPIMLKPSSVVTETASIRQRRLAIASRWHKARTAAALEAGRSAPVLPAPCTALSAPVASRQPRRGEFQHVATSYRGYDEAELLSLVIKVRAKELKFTEMQKLYADGKSRVPPAAVGKILYPKEGADERIKALEERGFKTMGAPRAVRSSSASNSRVFEVT